MCNFTNCSIQLCFLLCSCAFFYSVTVLCIIKCKKLTKRFRDKYPYYLEFQLVLQCLVTSLLYGRLTSFNDSSLKILTYIKYNNLKEKLDSSFLSLCKQVDNKFQAYKI